MREIIEEDGEDNLIMRWNGMSPTAGMERGLLRKPDQQGGESQREEEKGEVEEEAKEEKEAMQGEEGMEGEEGVRKEERVLNRVKGVGGMVEDSGMTEGVMKITTKRDVIIIEC